VILLINQKHCDLQLMNESHKGEKHLLRLGEAGKVSEVRHNSEGRAGKQGEGEKTRKSDQ